MISFLASANNKAKGLRFYLCLKKRGMALGLVLFLGSFLLLSCQGWFSEKPPVHLNPNMDFQPKREAQSQTLKLPTQTQPFGNAGAAANFLPPKNAGQYGASYEYGVTGDGGAGITPKQMDEIAVVTKGVDVAEGVFQSQLRYVAFVPTAVSKKTVKRGQNRFNIFCSACHDRAGTGLGLVVRRRVGMPQPTDLADVRIRAMSDGELFNVITHGRRNMPSYSVQIPVSDRWAIVSYVRALQLSRNATEKDIPAEVIKRLKKEQQVLDAAKINTGALPAPALEEDFSNGQIADGR